MDIQKQLPDHFVSLKGKDGGGDGNDPWRPGGTPKHSHDEDGSYEEELDDDDDYDYDDDYYDDDEIAASTIGRKGNKDSGAPKLSGRNKRNTEKDSLGSSVSFYKDRENRKDFHQAKQKIQTGGKSLTTAQMKQYAQTGTLTPGSPAPSSSGPKKKTTTSTDGGSGAMSDLFGGYTDGGGPGTGGPGSGKTTPDKDPENQN